MQRFASFAEVDRLDPESLKALLVGGEPPERVWAAWALGLRHDEAFARELRATAAEEPDAGVRRHLIVILAGAGQSRSVLTLAAHDPDERVRATALQYVARLARPADEEANELLARTLAAGPALLQLGCIAGLRPDAPLALWRAAEECITSPDRDLRWTAFESVIRHGSPSRAAPEIARSFLMREPELAARRDAIRVLGEQKGAEALRSLAADETLEGQFLPELVEALHQHRQQLPWREVSSLFERSTDGETMRRSLELLAMGSEGPARAALLQMFVDHCGWWEVGDEVLTRLRRALDQNNAPLDASERRLRDALASAIDDTAAQVRADPYGHVVTVDEADIDQAREILARLAALEVH